MMLKEKKLEFQAELEDTIEENKIYDLFEGMMKQLIVHRPKDPIDFLIKKLETNEPKRFVIVGPPGSQSHNVSLRMIEQLTGKNEAFECVNVGDLLVKEMKNRLELGKKIHESFSSHSYVEDEIVIELLKNIITEHEKNGINYIIEGFPKT
jgi:hypothetical protein